MAGVTDYPYRKICREMGAGLCTSEMVSARAVIEDPWRAGEIAGFRQDESPQSMQLIGGDPRAMAEAVGRVRDRVDHIDLNFGCPDSNVCRQGAGAAVPARPDVFRAVVRAAVTAAGRVPVTVKLRLGLDGKTITFRHAARIAEEEGCAAVALHARTVEDLYRGKARWEFIRELKGLVGIPVLGNGDVFRAEDGLRMFRETGCDAVLIGRGCLGNPWIFADLKAALEGREERPPPSVGEIARIIRIHHALLREGLGQHGADLKMRKFGAWYACGFPGAAEIRRRFQTLDGPEDLESILSTMAAESGSGGLGSPSGPKASAP
jgi:nifR3 family TIM-barrel protein